MALICFAVSLKVLALSEIILLGSPLLEVKHFRHQTKVVVVRSWTTSRWMAANNTTSEQPYTLFSTTRSPFVLEKHQTSKISGCVEEWWCFIYKGSGGRGGAINGLPSKRLQTTHLHTTDPQSNTSF